MKLNTKLKISFIITIFLPIVMCITALAVIGRIQARSISEYYQIQEDTVMNKVYTPISTLNKITQSIYEDMHKASTLNPEDFEDEAFLDEWSKALCDKLSALVVRKNGDIIYLSDECEIATEVLYTQLPGYGDADNESGTGRYIGNDMQCLVKQFDFAYRGNYYSVSIITDAKQLIPQLKMFMIEGGTAIILILIATSLTLTYWIYRSILMPITKLKLATQNIKEGNLDFVMTTEGNDEISNLCRDFEEMRVILKNNSEEKMQSEVEEKELIRNISHDLKTPITSIEGYVEGLLDGVADTPEKQQKYLKTIYNKAKDMDKLIDELTIYSRIDTNRVPYTFNHINADAYMTDCCEEIGMDLEARGVDLEYHNYSNEELVVIADTEQLKRVINNIVSNSVKYMPADRKGVIKIELFNDGDYALLRIQDNGKGISAKDLPRIFERFYRADVSRNPKQGGSGIGLAIVKKIIEDHDGFIWAESTEGVGTTMNIRLKRYKEVEESKEVPVKTKERSLLRSRNKKSKGENGNE